MRAIWGCFRRQTWWHRWCWEWRVSSWCWRRPSCWDPSYWLIRYTQEFLYFWDGGWSWTSFHRWSRIRLVRFCRIWVIWVDLRRLLGWGGNLGCRWVISLCLSRFLWLRRPWCFRARNALRRSFFHLCSRLSVLVLRIWGWGSHRLQLLRPLFWLRWRLL